MASAIRLQIRALRTRLAHNRGFLMTGDAGEPRSGAMNGRAEAAILRFREKSIAAFGVVAAWPPRRVIAA
jgi:hypothetical protein